MRTLLLAFTVLFFGVACHPKPATYEQGDQTPITAMQNIPIPSGWDIVRCESEGRVVPAANDRGFVAIRENQIGGNTGCNAFGGDWSAKDGRMEVPSVMATKMYCEDAADQERVVLGLLNGTVACSLQDDGSLILMDGTTKVHLRRNDERLK